MSASLAHMLLFVNLAVFLSRFEMELYDTTDEDMHVIDLFAPITKNPLKVKITEDRWESAPAVPL